MAELSYPNRPRIKTENGVWDLNILEWVAMQQPTINATTVTVTGALTDAQLRASDIPVAQDIYTVAMDFDASSNPIYIGMATQGSAKSASLWQIRKLTFDASNNPTDVQFSNGSKAFSAVWNDRTSLSYS